MKYVFITDIHGNLESLTTFTRSILPDICADRIICLGDIAGYNADPSACIDIMINKLGAQTIRGNHDRATGHNDFIGFSEHAALSGQWYHDHLEQHDLDLLAALPRGPLIVDGLLAIAHGAATDEDKYILYPYHSVKEFEWMERNDVDILFFGHTHIAGIFCQCGEKVNIIRKNKVKLKKGNRYCINPGSLGQPRDKNPNAAYAFFDTDTMTVELRRFAYPVEIAQIKILEKDVPYGDYLASRLSSGV